MTDFKSGDDVDGSPIELLARQAEELVLSSEPQQMIRHISKKAVRRASAYVLTGFKIGRLADFRSPCSPKCTALSRFREPQATALRFSQTENVFHRDNVTNGDARCPQSEGLLNHPMLHASCPDLTA